MGATNQIKKTNISLQLDNKKCSQCQQIFTKADLDDRNFDIWFDTSNDVRLIPMEELKEDTYYKPFGRTGYELAIWIRSIEHEYCPNFELCEGCEKKNKKEEMIYEKQRNVYWHPKCLKEWQTKEMFPGQHGKNKKNHDKN